MRRNLEIARNQLAADRPSRLGELLNIDIGPAIFPVCCATVAGAPLGALAINESILTKMTEAGAVTATAAIATSAGPATSCVSHVGLFVGRP